MHACGVSRTIRTQKTLRRCAKTVRAHLSLITENPPSDKTRKEIFGSLEQLRFD